MDKALRGCSVSLALTQKISIPQGEGAQSTSELIDSKSSFSFEWMNSDEAAEYLRLTVATLRNLTSAGQIPYTKLGRRNRYRKDQLRALLLQNKRGPL